MLNQGLTPGFAALQGNAMRLRPITLALASGVLFAAPAHAGDAAVDGSAPPRARVIAAASAAPAPVAAVAPVDPRVKAAWLGECRRRVAYYYQGDERRGTGGGIIGALLGGLVGGVIGNRIDDGPDRVAGTLIGGAIGATVGAVAGSAIGRDADRQDRADTGYDYCEAYFDDYYARQTYATAYTAQPAMMMVPVAVQQQPQQACPCTETVVTEEWVPVRARVIPRRRAVPDKRVPM